MEKDSLHLYKVLCGMGGVKILKFNIGTKTPKTITFQTGTTSKRIKIEELDVLQQSEEFHNFLFNNAFIYTTKNLEENLNLKKEYLNSCLKAYENKLIQEKEKIENVLNINLKQAFDIIENNTLIINNVNSNINREK